MQPNEVSNWFVLTLSAEQAALDEDFEHLDQLLRRREEILEEWDERNVTFNLRQQREIEAAENRLLAAMVKLRDKAGADLKQRSQRNKAVASYRASA
ncbi:MAG: hypothetical protein WCK51_01930 [Armatimonadota bacterium]